MTGVGAKKFSCGIDTITAITIVEAIGVANAALGALPKILYQRIDLKTLGSIVGALLCAEIAELSGAIVNPIEKGHPDILPATALGASEASLRNYPIGLEIKTTVGNVRQGSDLPAGKSRLAYLSGLTWQAHHQEVKALLGVVWDFAQPGTDEFMFPMITATFFSKRLTKDDWGAISGTAGRNTKVSGLNVVGKRKMAAGLIAIRREPQYLAAYSKALGLRP